MKRATVVIGANYGDEGKGRTVDFLASQLTGSKAVVRFNGGAQAGHTVTAPEGRHVFSHLASGSFVGAKTYLAKHYVCNPILFWKEIREFKGPDPIIAADPRCFITTPYDILVNQFIEDMRGDKRHGSVGVGFGETIERNNFPAFRLWKSDIKDRDALRQKVKNIRDNWLPFRLRKLGAGAPPPKTDTRMSDKMVDGFVDATLEFNKRVPSAGVEFIERDSIIFEGAQGLCLDQTSGEFPHVTRSNTGLTNVLPMAKALALELDVIYATRSYLTRHGAGPLPSEYVPNPPIVDKTNIDQPYQGTIRFGRLDVVELAKRIAADVKLGGRLIRSASLAVSCVDQMDFVPKVPDVPLRLASYGPARSDTNLAV